MARQDTLVSLDPISRKKKVADSPVSRLFKTRRRGGKRIKKSEPFGHYLFCGPQGSSKTTSCLWYAELLEKTYKRKGYKVRFFSNMGFGIPITKASLPDILEKIEYQKDIINIIIVDEIHSWYPKDTRDKNTLLLIDRLTGCFSQLRKRQAFVLSTAQVYGRLNKNLREQCLYMVNCKVSLFSKCVNDFIPSDDILCDDLGRWAGVPAFIYVHGLPKREFDTHKLISPF